MKQNTCDCDDRFHEIVEWMYVNDGAFSSKNEWRSEFIRMLASVLDVEGYEVEDNECTHTPSCDSAYYESKDKLVDHWCTGDNCKDKNHKAEKERTGYCIEDNDDDVVACLICQGMPVFNSTTCKQVKCPKCGVNNDD